MVRAAKVVIDRFRYADNVHVVARFLHIFRDFIAGIHAVVTAVIEEIADVVFFKDLQYSAVIGIVLGRVFKFVSSRAERRCGRVFQRLEFGFIFERNIEKIFVQNALYSVMSAQNARHGFVFEGFEKSPGNACVNNRRRSARLSENASSFKIFHKFLSFLYGLYLSG